MCEHDFTANELGTNSGQDALLGHGEVSQEFVRPDRKVERLLPPSAGLSRLVDLNAGLVQYSFNTESLCKSPLEHNHSWSTGWAFCSETGSFV